MRCLEKNAEEGYSNTYLGLIQTTVLLAENAFPQLSSLRSATASIYLEVARDAASSCVRVGVGILSRLQSATHLIVNLYRRSPKLPCSLGCLGSSRTGSILATA